MVNDVGFHRLSVTCLGLLLTIGLLGGCRPATTSTRTTFSDSVKDLLRIHATIANGNQGGDKREAHRCLHQVDMVLQRMAIRSANLSLPTERRAELESAMSTLSSCYHRLDAGHHGGEKIEYDALKDEIDAAIKTIQSCCQQ